MLDILRVLRAHVARKYGKQIRAAEAWGVSPVFVSRVLSGQKQPTEAILADAGIQRNITYTYVFKDDHDPSR